MIDPLNLINDGSCSDQGNEYDHKHDHTANETIHTNIAEDWYRVVAAIGSGHERGREEGEKRKGWEREGKGREKRREGSGEKGEKRLRTLLNKRNNVGYAITGAPVIRVINIRTKPMNTLKVDKK